jgi:hypothetical protein
MLHEQVMNRTSVLGIHTCLLTPLLPKLLHIRKRAARVVCRFLHRDCQPTNRAQLVRTVILSVRHDAV